MQRVELHTHTKMSAMDGLIDVQNLIRKAAERNQKAVAITDHCVVQGFPEAARVASTLRKQGKEIKVIYGMEGCMTAEDDETKLNHIVLLAKSQEGLKNLYKLVSISHTDYPGKRPYLPKSVIEKHREGLLLGSACYAGEVYQAILNGKSDSEIRGIASFYDYLEIMPLVNNMFLVENGFVRDEEALKDINKKIVSLGDALGKPVVATGDAHYEDADSNVYRQVYLNVFDFVGTEKDHGLYLKTTDEMLAEFDYLGGEKAFEVVIANTNKIADLVEPDIVPVREGLIMQETYDRGCELCCKNKVYAAGYPDLTSLEEATVYVEKYCERFGKALSPEEKDCYIKSCCGVKKKTSLQEGVAVIVPENMEIYDFTPVEPVSSDGSGDIFMTHFSYLELGNNEK